MTEKKRPTPFISIGSSSLLVVFLVLSIMIFAVLSFVSAKNDYEYSLKMASEKIAYYQACNRAEETLKTLSADLAKASPDSCSERDGFLIPIDDTRSLSVAYEILPQASGGLTYRITSWKVVMSQPWEGDDTLKLPTF
ncbi:MAG: hypothetical protein IKW28_08380 [Lachnospiraceae bacterium]|nr:hypothetical protein [Lachnospiraceae bacterium]